MGRFFQSLKYNVLYAIGATACALMPDFFLRFFPGQTGPIFKLGYLALLAAFFFCLSLSKSRVYKGVILSFLGILTLIQLSHLAYFGSFMSPMRYRLLLTEVDEISLSIGGIIHHLWYVIPLSILPWWGAYYLLTRPQCRSLPVLPLLCLFVLIFVPARLMTRTLEECYPNPKKLSLVNSLHAFFGYFTKVIPAQWNHPLPTFKPYTVDDLGSPSDRVIVLVMGESCSSQHMGIYGYGRPTTPFLSSLQGDPHFVAKQGYSAGVATKTSLPMFYGLIREPGNLTALESKTANLFKLAKQHGFQTIYISAQKPNLLFGVGAEFIDHVITYDDAVATFEKEKDAALLTLLKTIPLQKKAFVVLHQRSLHFPYEAGYVNCKACHQYPTKDISYKEYMRNSYDNGIIFNDYLFQEIFTYFKETVTVPTYLFYASDHGELMGENGRYGHSQLDADVAKIPFFAYIMRDTPQQFATFQKEEVVTHHELGLFLAWLLGYTVHNPNATDHVFFINGNHLAGLEGKIQLTKTSQGVTFQTIK